MKPRIGFGLIIGVSVIALATGCGGGGSSSSSDQGPVPTANALQITPSAASLPLGLTQKLIANAVYSDGSTKDVSGSATWTSSLTNIATVTASGGVTGLAIGTSTVTARLGSLNASATVTVTLPALVAITVDSASFSMPPNTRQQFTALGTYSDDSVRDITTEVAWTTSASNLATASSQGVVTALAPGGVIVRASSGQVTGTVNVSVTAAKLTSIAVIPYQAVFGIGVSEQFTALGEFDDNSVGELANVIWSSAASTVASVDSRGIVSTKAAGQTAISAAAATVSASTQLNVLPAQLTAIRVAPPWPVLTIGSKQRFTATGTFNDGSTRQLTNLNWASSDPHIAAISSDGVSQGMTAGAVQITASSGGITGATKLQVSNATLVSLSIAPALPTMAIWANKQLNATGIFSDGSSQDLTSFVSWTSHTPAVAKVNRLGLANGTSVGSTVVTAEFGSFSGTTTLTVSPLHVASATLVPVDSSLTPGNPVIPQGVKEQLQLVGNLTDGNTQIIEDARWLSKKIVVATIDGNGVVTGRGSGSAWIFGEGCCETASLPLKVLPATLQSMVIARESSGAVPIGATEQFHAFATFFDPITSMTIADLDITNSVHWSSSAPSATIDEKGRMTVAAGGKTTITGTFGFVSSQSASADVQLSSATLASLFVNPGSATVILGGKQQFEALGSFSDGSAFPVADLLWSTSDARVAVIDGSGLVFTAGRGSAVVTASSPTGIHGSASINVN